MEEEIKPQENISNNDISMEVTEDMSYKEKKASGKDKEVSESQMKKIEAWIEEQDARIVDENGKRFNLFDNTLKYNLYWVRKDLDDNWDYFMVIDGKEGSGKSTFAMNIASYVDPSFTIERMNLTAKDLISDLEHCKKQAIVFDEAGTQLYSRQAMSAMNILLNKIFMISRAKNLFIILCIPSFFMLDSYVRDHRVNALLHLVMRGHYVYYNEQKTKSLSINGGKFKNHNAVRGNFVGNANKNLAPNIKWEEYEAKKNNYIDTFLKQLLDFKKLEDKKENIKLEEDVGEFKIERKMFTLTETSKILGIARVSLRDDIVAGKIPAKSYANRWNIPKTYIDEQLKSDNKNVKIKNYSNLPKLKIF